MGDKIQHSKHKKKTPRYERGIGRKHATRSHKKNGPKNLYKREETRRLHPRKLEKASKNKEY